MPEIDHPMCGGFLIYQLDYMERFLEFAFLYVSS